MSIRIISLADDGDKLSGDAVLSQRRGLKLASGGREDLLPECDAGYVRGAPYPSPSLRIGAGTRRSLAANDSDAWRSRFVDLPATAAGSVIRVRKCK